MSKWLLEPTALLYTMTATELHVATMSATTSCNSQTIASFPGPAQLFVAISTEKQDTLFHTASDRKLGGAWERGYPNYMNECCCLGNATLCWRFPLATNCHTSTQRHSLTFCYFKNLDIQQLFVQSCPMGYYTLHLCIFLACLSGVYAHNIFPLY